MSWSQKWEGRATDFIPDLLSTTGKPGRMAAASRDALWASVQAIAEADVGSWVRVTANGWEDSGAPGLGEFNLKVEVLSEPTAVQESLLEQQPHDLLASRGSTATPASPEPASSA